MIKAVVLQKFCDHTRICDSKKRLAATRWVQFFKVVQFSEDGRQEYAWTGPVWFQNEAEDAS